MDKIKLDVVRAQSMNFTRGGGPSLELRPYNTGHENAVHVRSWNKRNLSRWPTMPQSVIYPVDSLVVSDDVIVSRVLR